VRILILILLFNLFAFASIAQVTGGESVMQFLRMPNSPQVTALGGTTVCNPNGNMMLGFSNPALLRPLFHNTLSINNNFYLAGTNINNIAYSHYDPKSKITFGGLINNVAYPAQQQTDALGNIIGELYASEQYFQITVSKNYQKKWRYGASAKLAHSKYATFNSSALLGDFGIVYFDTAKLIYFGMLAKNIGFQLDKFTNGSSEPLPFDMQIGVSKKFSKAPFRISLLVHHLYQWDIRYDNPLDKVNSSLFGTDSTISNYTIDKIFRHAIIGVDVVLSKNFELNFAYNHQRRGELGLKEKLGLAGFSMGTTFNLKKFQISYSRSTYNQAGTYNDLGVNFKMKELFGLGKKAPEGLNW
jgi:hypothetical protein